MRVLVTGASRGIGRAICERLARDGAHVAACASGHGDELDDLGARIHHAGGSAVPLLGDLQDVAVPARLVAEAAAALGGLDAVVGNAGISSPGPLATLDVADWDRVFSVNVRAQWLLARAAFTWLQQSRGSLVTVALLLGPDAAYMTGHNLLVDGGLLDSVQSHLAGRPRSES